MSLYDELGVSSDASQDEIAAAYRRLAKQHHPDAGGDADAFALIGRAVAVLRDPERRAEYDATGREDFTEVSPDAEALAILSGKFGEALNAFIQGQMPLWTDVIAHVRSALGTMGSEQRTGIAEAKAARVRITDALCRLGHSGKGPDVLRSMLTSQADTIDRAIAAMTAHVATIEQAIALAGQWTWKADAAQARPMTIQELMQGGGYTFVGGGFASQNTGGVR